MGRLSEHSTLEDDDIDDAAKDIYDTFMRPDAWLGWKSCCMTPQPDGTWKTECSE